MAGIYIATANVNAEQAKSTFPSGLEPCHMRLVPQKLFFFAKQLSH